MRNKNAKQLADELLKYSINVFVGGSVNNLFWATKTINEEPSQKQKLVLKNVDQIEQFQAYTAFKDEVQNYQVRNNISSIYFVQKEWDNYQILYPKSEVNLIPLWQDKKIMERHKHRIVNWFLDIATIYIRHKKYSLLENNKTNELSEIQHTISSVKMLAENYEWASLTKYCGVTPIYPIGVGQKMYERKLILELNRGLIDTPESIEILLKKTWKRTPLKYRND